MSEETKEEAVSQPSDASVSEGAVAEQTPHKGFLGKVDNYFGITKSGSKFRTEIVAGVTTFMAMVYILMVNAGMFELIIGGDDPYGASYIATAIGAIVGTLLMAFLAKMPLAQASGMGVNAFICYTLVSETTGLSYANCMVFTLIDGVIFLILTATGLRQRIFEAIPASVRKAIGVGIGLFIAYIGALGAGVISVAPNQGNYTVFTDFSFVNGATYGGVLPAFIALVGLAAIGILSKKNVKGAVLWGVLGSAVLYYVLGAIGLAWGDEACQAIFDGITIQNPLNAFAAWGKDSVGVVFYKGFDFTGYFGLGNNNVGTFIILLITTALSLCMIDMFDTIGTLYGACEKGNLLDENGVPIRMNRMMLSDAIATCAGALAGTSTVTTFVESSSGVAAGGKTGFTALVTAACFLVAMFLSPIARLVPSCATATALMWVGVLMMSGVAKIDWTDAGEALIAFVTVFVMAFGYSISKGIGAGIISYVVVAICTGKIKEIKVATWVIAALYIAYFVCAQC